MKSQVNLIHRVGTVQMFQTVCTTSAVARDGSGNYATSTISITVKQNHSRRNTISMITSQVVSNRKLLLLLLLPLPLVLMCRLQQLKCQSKVSRLQILLPGLVATTTSPEPFNKDLRFGMTDLDVMLLQKYLNTHGFTVLFWTRFSGE